MAYRSDRGIEWIDRVTKRMTQTPDGADRLSRWLVVGFGLLALSIPSLVWELRSPEAITGSSSPSLG